MPTKKIRIWPIGLPLWQAKPLPMEPSILLSIVENFFDFIADNKPIISVDSRVASIQDTVDVFPQKNSIRFDVQTAL